MSFLLSIEGMIAAAFVAGLVLGLAFSNRWKTVGWGLTGLAAAYAMVRLATHQANVPDIFFAAMWAAIGAFPGAALGSWIYRRFKRAA